MSPKTRAVFFDMYNTILHLEPLREDIQQRACREFGLELALEPLRRALSHLDGFWIEKRAQNRLLAQQGQAVPTREALWAEYEMRLLQGMGFTVNPERAAQIAALVRQSPSRYVLYGDVLPTLEALAERGVCRGLISNISQPLASFAPELRLPELFDVTITSYEAGADKPDPAIFHTALAKARVQPAEAIHVGDQYEGDVLGARAAGMQALLLDRHNLHPDRPDCPRLIRLGEVLHYLLTE